MAFDFSPQPVCSAVLIHVYAAHLVYSLVITRLRFLGALLLAAYACMPGHLDPVKILPQSIFAHFIHLDVKTVASTPSCAPRHAAAYCTLQCALPL